MQTHDGDRCPDESLDPQNWEAFRQLAHGALDEAISYVQQVRETPVWQPVPENVKHRLKEPLPLTPQGIENTYCDFRELILPYPTGNIHPRFWGWVHGTGLATGILSEMLSAAMNSNCGGRDHGALYVERTVIDWCRHIIGYPSEASGVLVSGTSMGSVIGLAVARNARAGCDVRAEGIRCAPKALVTYASKEAHSSVGKALELLGLGHASLRKIAVDEKRAIRPEALLEAIKEDRQAGREPFCVVGCAGTVNTGAIDDLAALAKICRDERLWFHVDGAFGALCALSDSLRPLIRGIELSDSIAFDFHKWLYVQYDAGCVLVRDRQLHSNAFATRPDYLRHLDRGLAGGGEWFTDFGPELSRSFRALKVWFALKEHGTRRFGEMIEKNCRQARYLARLIEADPRLELLAEPTLNIVCFRYRPPGANGEDVDQLNRDIVADLQERGMAAPSTTRLNGKVAIRVAIVNHRSRREDFDLLARSVVEVGNQRTSG
ncbi:MAG: amino acid decarboxylase [Acidobacteriaceae bacterium]|nr:amino acid decarboxylase [Acidobacteriaceae bacterium]